MKIAVVGAGWAGMAAAVTATQAGHAVTVFEAARQLGGRARALNANLADGTPVVLDNGQHILIGAYSESLALMQAVGVDIPNSLKRLPLALQFPDGDGLALGHWPSPIDALLGMLTLRGWTWRDKWSLLKSSVGWQLRGFACAPHRTVADLCHGLTPRVMETLIEPLCVSALNTPGHRASGQVFLTVLRDSLFGGSGSSNLLLPTTDLASLFPKAAAQWIEQRGGAVRLGARVESLRRAGVPGASTTGAGAWQLNGEEFDAVIWATNSSVAAQTLLAAAQDHPGELAKPLAAWSQQAQALQFEAIATVYAYAPDAHLPQPMLALRSDATHPAQFVFDRGQLGGPPGLLALVVSASALDRDALQYSVLAQAQTQLGAFLNGGPLRVVQTVVEKRATFACTPALHRPPTGIAPGLFACGDYIAGPYPATLEGAVRSGVAAGKACIAQAHIAPRLKA